MKHLLRLFLLLLPVFVLKSLFAQSTGNIHLHIPGDQLYACWSPNGQRLVYQSNQKGNWDLFLYDLQTGHSRELADSSTDEQHPVWVPGKQAVIFEMANIWPFRNKLPTDSISLLSRFRNNLFYRCFTKNSSRSDLSKYYFALMNCSCLQLLSFY